MRALDFVSGGLFFTWLIHDIEELLTYRQDFPKTFASIPLLPKRMRREGISQNQVNVGIALMGALMAWASIDGYRSQGRSWLFQSALFSYGLHGFGHIAQSIFRRRYTTGVVTSPIVVIPFWAWATKTLRREGIPDRTSWRSLLLFALVPASMIMAGVITRGWETPDRPK